MKVMVWGILAIIVVTLVSFIITNQVNQLAYFFD